MNNLKLEKNEIERDFNKIEKITQRSKSNGNSSCFVFHFGDENFVLRSGQRTRLQTFCMFFKSDKSYEFIDKKNIPLQDIWVFIDLKRKNHYIVSEGKIIDNDFVCVLYSCSDEATAFSAGFYCGKDNCTLIYDADCANAMFDMSINYYNAVTNLKFIVQKTTDIKEENHNEF